MQYFFISILIALQNIRANPLHTFLSTLGIIIGVASLVAILTLVDGLEKTGRDQIAQTTSLNVLTIRSKSTKVINNVRVSIEDRQRITIDNAIELSQKYYDKAVVEFVDTKTTELVYGDSLLGIYLQGNMHRGLELASDSLAKGQYLSYQDILNSEKVVVLTNQVVKSLGLESEKVIGDSVLIGSEMFEIIGIFPPSDDDTPRAYIPITTYTLLEESYPNIIMKVNRAEEIPVIEDEMKQWLNTKFEKGEEAFQFISNQARIVQFSQGILLFKLIMGAITGISVLVGGIGVMNVLLISVTERTKEIGIRKATGAKPKDIILQFMAESITVSLVGCILGWIVGLAGLLIFVPIVNAIAQFEFVITINIWTVFTILGIALIIGVVFGTYPAWRASKLDPIDAIRHE